MNKNIKLKKSIFASFMCIIFAFFAFALVGCGDKYADMKLSLSKTQITLTLENNISNEEEVIATVEGDSSISRDVVVETDYNQLNITTVKNNNKTIITVSATDVCTNAIVTVKSLEGGKTATFVVNVVIPVKNLNVTTDESELYVVKGTPRALSVSSLIVFEPLNTTQKEITFSLSTSTDRARIKDGNLIVDKNYSNSTIKIKAQSEFLGDDGVIIEFTVLPPLDESTVLFSSISYKNSGTSLLNEDNSVPSMINMASNLAISKTIEFVIEVQTLEEVSIKPYIESTKTYSSKVLSFDSGTIKKSTLVGGIVKTEYTVLLNCAEQVTTDKVYFEIEYKNYNFTYQTSKIKINVQDAVNDIHTYINGSLSSNSNLVVYDKYSGTKGLQLSFEALPTTLSSGDRTLILQLGENAGYYNFWKKGQSLPLNDESNNKFVDNKLEIKSGEVIYISAISGNKPSAKISIYSKNNELVKKEFTLQSAYGTTSIQFLNASESITELNGDVSYHYYIASNTATLQTLKFKSDVMDISGLSVELSGETISIESEPILNYNCYSFDVKTIKNSEGTSVITLKQANGYYVKAYVHAVYALQENEIVFSVPSSQTNASVGYMERQAGKSWQFKVAIKKNNSVTLTQEGQGVDNIVYSYCELTDSSNPDYDTFFQNVVFDEKTFNNYSDVLDTSYLALEQLTIKNTGKVIVKAVVNGFSFEIDNTDINNPKTKLIDKSFTTYFFVEGYVPIENVKLSQYVVNLYSQNSVGYDDLALTTTKVELNFNEGATYSQNISWENCVSNGTLSINDKKIYTTILGEDKKSLTITALSTWQKVNENMIEQDEVTYIFQAVIKEFNTEYRVALTVNIIKAQQVEKIIVENVNVKNGLYIPLVYDEKEIVKTIDAVAQVGESGKLPFNSNLVYEFLPNSTLSANGISLNRKTGVLKIASTANIGGVGVIRVAPADRYNLQNKYEAGEIDVAIYINLVVADGQSRATSYRITKLSDLNNYALSSTKQSSMHFTLMNNIEINTINDFALFENFNGGLYGAVQGDTNIATITTNKTLFDTIAENACVEDLIVCGNVEGNAFVANTNNGSIKNISIEAIEGEQKQFASPSVLTASGEIVGGICATNNGVVAGCLFSGQIISTNTSATTTIGGIVGINTSSITNSAVEFYSYARFDGESVSYSYGKIDAVMGFVGGIVGQMMDGAKLTNSYAKSYATTTDNLLLGTTVFALIGNFVKGNVDVCFAEINNVEELFDLTESEATVNNAYILFNNGTQNGVYFVNGVQKSFLEAKTDIISNNVWLNESGDEYPTFKNIKAPTPLLAIADKFVASEKTISNDSTAIMFYYNIKTSLTLQETFALDDLNFVSFEDLFGKNTYGIRAITSDSKIISTSSTGLSLNSVGEVTISFYSKYDANLTKEFTVYVMNPVNNLTFVAGSVEFGENDLINVKLTQGFSFTAKIDDKILLDARKLNFEINQMYLKTQESYVTGSNMGPMIVDTQNLILGENYIHYCLQLKQASSDSYINDLLKSKYFGDFALNIYKGADKLDIDTTSVSIEPIDYAEVQVIVLTDDKDDDLSIALAPNANYPIDLFKNLLDEYEVIVETEYYLDSDCLLSCSELDAKYFKKIFTIKFSIQEKYRNLDFNNAKFYFTINATSAELNTEKYGTKNLAQLFVLEVSNQQILSASVAHYENTNKTVLKDSTTNTNFVFYEYNTNLADSTIAPGEEGLLKIDLFPTYSRYDYLTVTYTTLNNDNLKMYLSCMEEYTYLGKKGYKQSVKNVTDLENGIKISSNAVDNFDNVSTIFLGTYIPLSIEEDNVFVLTIRAYNNDEIVKETQFNLVVAYTAGAIINLVDLDGNDIVAANLDSEQILTITIPKEDGMTINAINIYGYESIDSVDAQIVLTQLQIVEDSFSLARTYKYSLYIGKSVRTIDNANYITIEADMSWMANGKIQNKTTSITLPIVEFLINDIELLTERTDKTTYYSYIGIESNLQLNLDITPDASNYDDDNNPITQFLQNCYYESIGQNENSKYIVNVGKGYASTFLRNLYYVDGAILTPLCNSDGTFNKNSYFTFEEKDDNIVIIGKRQGEVNLRFVMQIQYPSKIGQTIKEKSFDFTIIVTPYSDEDLPLIIDNENAFWNAMNAETPQNYILMNDLYLEDVSPINTNAIQSLDGNNYTIHILSWNTDIDSNSLNLALFNTVNSITTLKNLTVNIYHATNIAVDTNVVTSIHVAGFAITNLGTIYNCEVVSYKSDDTLQAQTSPGIKINYLTDQITDDIVCNVAGFAITNSGYISNSRVGGTTLEKASGYVQQLETFNITAQGNISGFVDTNSGTISSCFFANGTLTNTLISGKQTTTSGFVKTNNNKITGSYVKGTGDDAFSLSGQGITTVSIGSGFAYSNVGTISNCYSNILLASFNSVMAETYESGRLSAGFVYSNLGQVDTCYSSSKIENARNTQMAFVGVDEQGNLLNNGKIKYSYYYIDENIEENAYSNESSNLNVTRVSNPTDTDNFYGFAFTTDSASVDGVWVVTDYGIDLVSANQIAISKRTVANQKYDEKTNELLSYNLPYLSGYEYGSAKNPIIIRNAEEFNLVFGGNDEKAGSAISSYYSLTEKYVTGNYRLVCDINLQELNPDNTQDVNVSSTQMNLLGGVFDGNLMTISGIDLTANTDYISNYFGLFAKVTDNACIKNLDLNVISISAKKVKYVGTLAGSVENSKIININVQKQNTTTTSYVLGNNVVGGLVALVYGNSEIKSIVVDSLSVKANALAVGVNQNYNRTSSTSQISNLLISYAGGVIGIADIYTAAEKNSYSHSTNSSNAQLLYIIAKGEMQIRASTVGGVVGYLGPQTTLRDTTFESTDNSTTKIIAYNFYAGGIVGECQGNIDMARAEHSEAVQKEIEDNIDKYYHNPSLDIQRGNLSLFEDVSDGEVISTYEPIAIGGIVGMLYTGEIQHSYSKVNVINSNVKYAGGVVGQIVSHTYPKLSRNLITLFEVYAFGDVYTGKKGFAAGGIAGYIDSGRKVTMSKVNAVNYWSVQYNEKTKSYYLPENIYQIYAMTNATKNEILELNDVVNADNLTLKDEDYDLPTISYTASNNMMYAITEVKFYNKQSVISEYIQKSYATQVLETDDVYLMVEDPFYGKQSSEKSTDNQDYLNSQAVTPYYDLNDSTTNGLAMNTYFLQAGWDTNYWIQYTKTHDLFPSLVTYSGSMTYYIDVASDLQKMVYHPYATFIVRALDQPVKNGKHLVKVGSYIESTKIDLSNFSGTLKGLDGTQNYGFDFECKSSFISATTSATFKNLTILNLGTNTANVTDELNQAFVDVATLTSFENIYFENCYSNSIVSTDNYNLGILTNYMKGGSLKNISMQNCGVSGYVQESNDALEEINIGIVCGKMESSGNIISQVQDVYVYQTLGEYNAQETQNCAKLTINENVNLKNTQANIAGIIGQTVGNVVTNYSSQTTTTDTKHIGIAYSNSQTAYVPTNAINTTKNFGTTVSILGQGKLNTANIGIVYGKVSNSTIKTSTSQSLLVVGNVKCVTPQVNQINCGGLVGKATTFLSISGSSNENRFVKVDVNMDLKTTSANSTKPANKETGVNAGMIVGTTATTNTIQNIDSYGKIIAETTTTENDLDLTNIGGFVGEAKTKLAISKAVSRTYISYSGKSANIGGFVGKYERDSLNICDDSYNTKYLGTMVVDAESVCLGGLVGAASNNAKIDITGSVFGGNIKLAKTQNAIGTIYAGGLLGSAGNATVTIENSISYGELNLLSYLSQDLSDCTIYLGGLLGVGNNKTTLSNNVSISTVASKTSVAMSNVNINALVGDANGASGNKNFYSHQVSLCLDLNDENIGAINEFYPELQNIVEVVDGQAPSLEYNLNKYLSTLSTAELKEESPKNSKFSPYVINDASDWQSAGVLFAQEKSERLFVVVNRNLKTLSITSNPLSIVNSQIVGNGVKIYTNNALCSTVDQLSAISGVSVKPNISSSTSTYDALSDKSGAGTIANVNNGYIFACTVVSDDISSANNYELKISSGYGGGLVGVNTGVIMDCMTSININGNSTTGGLVGYNFKGDKICGIIISSYTVGKVDKGYAFSSGNGDIYASYTASPAQNGVFGSSASVYDSFYDVYAVGCSDKTNLTASTNKVSIIDDITKAQNIKNLFSTQNGDEVTYYEKNALKFGFGKIEDENNINVGVNFGYPTFSGVAYKDFDYMQGINTGDGTKDNPIMINSVGKLQQISSATTKDLHYKLIYNISVTDAMKTVGINTNIYGENFGVANWKPIENFKGNLDGKNFKVSNIYTTSGGKWAVFGEVGDNDSSPVIKNITFAFGSITGSSDLSTVATSILNTTLQNIIVTANSLTTSSGSVSGLVCTAKNNSKILGITVDIGTLSASGNVSGLVGSATNSTIGDATGRITMKISNLNGGGDIGGLIADTNNADTSTSITNVTFSNGLNITATNSNACAGGLFGKSTGNINLGTISLSSVTFKGDTGFTAGGLAGSCTGFKGNVSIGTVTLSANSSNTVTFGGLVGKGSGSLTLNSNVSISNPVSITQTGSGALVAGGVVGYLSENAQVQLGLSSTLNSTNAATTFGGIVGQATGGKVILTSNYTLPTSISISTSTTNDIGGIVGNLSGGTITSSDSTNKSISGTFSGTVSNASSIGAVAGTISGEGKVEKININGSGLSLSGTQAGGVAGIIKENATLQHVNVNSVSFNGDSFGAVAGSISGGTVDNVTVSSVTLTGKNIGALAGSVTGGTIKNFTVSSGTITGKVDGSTVYVGALAPTISGATLENITVASGVSVKSETATTTYIGGWTGSLSSNVSGTNSSSVNLSATGTSYVGGIAGTSSGTISGVTTSGTIESSYIAGGVVAEVTSGSISGCTNSASITCGTQETDASTVYAGGIVGNFSGSSISDCTNNANVTAGWQKIGKKLTQRDMFWHGDQNDPNKINDFNDDNDNQNSLIKLVSVKNSINNNSLGSAQSYASGLCGYSSNNFGINNSANSGTIIAKAKVSLNITSSQQLDDAKNDMYIHYATETENAYASEIGYSQNILNLNNCIASGNTKGGGFFEFNITTTDRHDDNNRYCSVILDYRYTGTTFQNYFSTVFPNEAFDSDEYSAWTENKYGITRVACSSNYGSYSTYGPSLSESYTGEKGTEVKVGSVIKGNLKLVDTSDMQIISTRAEFKTIGNNRTALPYDD